jgi:hypothetical protein
MNRRALKAKANRFLVYRAWKTADDPLVRPSDIARVTGLKRQTVSHILLTMRLSHNSDTTNDITNVGRLPVDTFMRLSPFSRVVARETY